MPPVQESLSSVPTTLLLLVPAVSLLLSYGVVLLALQLFGTEQSTPVGVAATPDGDTGPPDDPSENHDHDQPGSESISNRVTCPECGVENTGGYRFCRSCVSELPGSDGPRFGPSKPFLRGIN